MNKLLKSLPPGINVTISRINTKAPTFFNSDDTLDPTGDKWNERVKVDHSIERIFKLYQPLKTNHHFGIVLNEYSSNLVVLDVDVKTMDIDKYMTAVLEHFKELTYVEQSSGGKGYHIIFTTNEMPTEKQPYTAKRPDKISKDFKDNGIECFADTAMGNKFLIITGKQCGDIDTIKHLDSPWGLMTSLGMKHLKDSKEPNKVESDLMAIAGRGGNNLELIKKCLMLRTCIGTTYDQWRDIGFAIHHETNGSDIGLKLFDAWSQADKGKYNKIQTCAELWSSSNDNNTNNITLGTLVKWSGWKPKAYTHREKTIWGLKQRLKNKLITDLGINNPKGEVGFDETIVDKIFNNCFWHGSKGAFFVCGEDVMLQQHTQKDTESFVIRKLIGSIVNYDKVEDLAKTVGETEKETKTLTASCTYGLLAIVLREIKILNHRNHLEASIDMFTTETTMSMDDDIAAKMSYPYRPLVAKGCVKNDAIVADYVEHFPRFKELVKMMVYARFASDRKKSYIWIHAPSDWGKNMLRGAMYGIGVVTEISIKQIEAVFEGKPLGKYPESFLRSWVLFFEEFKGVNSELKQLESTMDCRAMGGMAQTVQLYTKLFFSADSVSSLTGNNGVEDQFANRFSYFQETSSPITKRAMFLKVGKDKYRQALSFYIAESLNNAVNKMVELGRDKATKHADMMLDKFHAKYTIAKQFGNLEENIQEWVEEMRTQLISNIDQYNSRLDLRDFTVNKDGVTYLKSPSKVIGDYIYAYLDKSEWGMYYKKRREFVKMLDLSPHKKQHPYFIGGTTVKAIILSNKNTEVKSTSNVQSIKS